VNIEITPDQDLSRIFSKIDVLIKRVDQFKSDPQFSDEVKKRTARKPSFDETDDEVFGRVVKLIAYSQAARTSSVKPLIENGIFKQIFDNYSVEEVAKRESLKPSPEEWEKIGAIRFPTKVKSMICAARSILEIQRQHGSFMSYLATVGLPANISSESQIEAFWNGFDQMRKDLKEIEFPFLQSFTTLCHFLMNCGFDCAKPDSGVMAAATDLGIVPRLQNKKAKHSESDLRNTVLAIQKYTVARQETDKRPSVIEMYFLIQGGQSGAKGWVSEQFYAS
jgi:3-methyladenine DNA glycosylase Tag